MNTVLSTLGETVASTGSALGSAAISYTVGEAANYVLNYVTSTALPSLLYNSAYWTAQGTNLGLKFSGKVTSTILSKIHPNLGEASCQTQSRLGFAADKADEWVTDHVFNHCYPDFTPAELAGPMLLTAVSGWMAGKSLHRLAKDIKMLSKGERIETIRFAKYETSGVRVLDEKFIPHSTLSLTLSSVRNLILAPIFAGIGYYTEQGIANRLSGLGIPNLPVPTLTLTAIAISSAVQTYAWLKAKENHASISLRIEDDQTNENVSVAEQADLSERPKSELSSKAKRVSNSRLWS